MSRRCPLLHPGHNVLIHCLAGAHRAGTSGVAYVMHSAGLPLAKALAASKARRACINPICGLVKLLQLLERAEASARKQRGGS